MTIETIQTKKLDLEEEFKKIEENRQKALTIVEQCSQGLIRLQGAYAQLVEIEKELTTETDNTTQTTNIDK